MNEVFEELESLLKISNQIRSNLPKKSILGIYFYACFINN